MTGNSNLSSEEEIIEKVTKSIHKKYYDENEGYESGYVDSYIKEAIQKALSLQRQENLIENKKYFELGIESVNKIWYAKFASLQEKIEKVFPELSYCKNFKSIETEEDFLMWLNAYNKVRIEEILKIFKELRK